MRNILCLYSDDYYDLVTELLPLENQEDVNLELRKADSTYEVPDLQKFTDIVIVGFTYNPEQIEKFYLSGILHILTVDIYHDEHPLIKINVNKDPMPFLDYRGKWSILLGESSWYRATLKNLVQGKK